MPSSIVKLVYKQDYFDLVTMSPGAKNVITITDDGLIIKKEYAPGSRKAHSVDKSGCSVEEFAALCERLLECIEPNENVYGCLGAPDHL